MESVTASTTFDSDLDDLVAHCRTLESRKAWPGAVLMSSTGGKLMYQVSMRLKAAEITDIDIREEQSAVEELGDGSRRFVAQQRVSWPDGMADAQAEYVFTPGSPSTLTFTYRYEPPSGKLVKKKALPAFHEGMQKVAAVYVRQLPGPVRA